MATNDFEALVRLVIQSTLKTKFHYFQMFLLNNSIFLTDSLKGLTGTSYIFHI